jgi:DNA-directed RNA polymerase subunit RPC12/RpoP
MEGVQCPNCKEKRRLHEQQNPSSPDKKKYECGNCKRIFEVKIGGKNLLED